MHYIREDAISSGIASLVIAEVRNDLGATVAFKFVWTESISSAEGSCGAEGAMLQRAMLASGRCNQDQGSR